MVLKPAKVDKALILGDAMAMIEAIKEVRGYTLNDIYAPPENDKIDPSNQQDFSRVVESIEIHEDQ